MIDLLEAYQPWSNPDRPLRIPLPVRAKKAGKRKLTRVDQRGLDDPHGRPRTGRPARVGRPARMTHDDSGRPSAGRKRTWMRRVS